ncbi:unnamed protein product [Oncorhynchus mykiss]|uniref:C1q domain-containing protein n=1 Tax=Oncorhynchus mykiss TaxID=8022 RepID=A0A060YDJ2_ONCMY|nr:unnamed protein product [Oncorhynchus mykiss]
MDSGGEWRVFCLSGEWTQEESGGCSVCLGNGLKRRVEGVLSVWGMDSRGEWRVFCLSGEWTHEESGGGRENDITQRTGEQNMVSEFQIETQRTEATGTTGKRTTTPPDVWAELRALRDMVVEQRVELWNLGARLQASESENAGYGPKVAFYAALTDSGAVGPFSSETNLIYIKVFTNIGNALPPTYR